MRSPITAFALIIGLLWSSISAAADKTTNESVSLFDGKTLAGWEGDAKWWSVQDDALTGGSSTEKVPHNYFLATEKSFHNFDLTLKIKVTGDAATGMINSGVQIRSVRVPGSTEMSGYQVDAGDGWWGKMYDESRRNKVIAESADLKAVNAAVKNGDWNEYRILAEGPRIQSWVNGVPALDYTEADSNIALDGRIAIQIHSGGMAVVQVKDVHITELPPTANATTWEKLGGYKPWPKEKKPEPKEKPLKEGNASAAKPNTPEQQLVTFKVPDGFEVELVAAEDEEAGIGKFIAVYFDQKGRMWSMTALEYPVDGNENPAAADALYQSRGKDKVLVFDTPFAQGPQKPRVYADGLAIPLGILPYQDGCYALHGPDIIFLKDTDNDGKADERQTILTGFGVQDSHLFPHQFTRAPGGWLWMAQGAFNYSKVRRPGDAPELAIQFDQTRMAKFHPDGARFDITSNGPCNIWGLVLNGEGEAFIQEANDFGYPVMPFHEYANYPGCSNKQWKSYAPEFPGTADFRVGGTGLSGLVLTDAHGIFPNEWSDVMLVANPITRKINSIKMHREGDRWRLEHLPDFVDSTDEMFRPVAMTLGPDGCVYIVDWYNKIISHNEVPRTHPDRDKIRGRIWRVKPKAKQPLTVPDFTKISGDELLAKLGSDSLAQSHLAWQTIVDRKMTELEDKLDALSASHNKRDAATIQALWALEGLKSDRINADKIQELLKHPNRNVRREAIRVLGNVATIKAQDALSLLANQIDDADAEVRAEVIKTAALFFAGEAGHTSESTEAIQREAWQILMLMVKAPLDGPVAKSTHNAKNVIKVGDAYEREFERYLIRMFLERQPEQVAAFLASFEAGQFSVESRLLAALSLDAETSVPYVAALLPRLERAPGREEVLRLVTAMDKQEASAALKAALAKPAISPAVLEAMLEIKDRVDAGKLAPLVTSFAAEMLNGNQQEQTLALRMVSGFKLSSLQGQLLKLIETSADTDLSLMATRAMGEAGSVDVSALITLSDKAVNGAVKDELLSVLAGSGHRAAADFLLGQWSQIPALQKKSLLNRMLVTPDAAKAVTAAFLAGKLTESDVDGAMLERLQALLPGDADVTTILQRFDGLFRPVLSLNGSEEAWSETDATLEGALTVETWVRFDPSDRKPHNTDGIFGLPGKVDVNFYNGNLRVFGFAGVGDIVVAEKTMVSGMWTHVAVTRNAEGIWKLYMDGEPVGVSSKAHAVALVKPRIGWTAAHGGTRGALSDYRIWSRERSVDEIRSQFDRGLPEGTPGLVWNSASGGGRWGKLQSGASMIKTGDLPPTLTAEQAIALDAKFEKYRSLAAAPGNVETGKAAAMLCISCHLIGGQGGNIGPNLSGVGAMGVEGILRNILTPNAAMESAYRTYRVELKDGRVLEGFQAGEDKDAVLLRTPGAEDQRIKRADIREAKFLRRSLMPEGLLDALPDQMVSDLFSYLMTLK